MAADYSAQSSAAQSQVQNLYRQIKNLDCKNTTEILRTTAVIERLLAQYPENVELLILQTHIEILNSREQRARAIAHRVWEIGGDISLLLEKMYLDDLINLGLLEMAMILIKPRFAELADNIDIFPLEMIKFALITGSVKLLKRICAYRQDETLFRQLMQFAEAYEYNNYEDHFKNIQKIVMESFGEEICAYDYNVYGDRGFTDVEIVLYFSNYDLNLKKYKVLLENRIDGYCLTSQVKRIHNLSFVFRNIKDHPKFV